MLKKTQNICQIGINNLCKEQDIAVSYNWNPNSLNMHILIIYRAPVNHPEEIVRVIGGVNKRVFCRELFMKFNVLSFVS